MNRDTQITADFNLHEFIRPVDPMPDENVINNLVKLMHALQAIRDVIGKPFHIDSGYRTVQHNAEVGGNPNSYHLKGMAADIVIEGMPPSEFQRFMRNWSGGLGSYPTFTHVDIGPKRRWNG